jgi:hypothetical protein
MKILFLTTQKKDSQGDLLEVAILYGLRKILGKDCIDFPRKKIMYHDWSDTQKNNLHGNGFNLLRFPLEETSTIEREDLKDVDVILYGCGWIYENPQQEKENIEWVEKTFGKKTIWYLDSHDLVGEAAAGKYIYHNGERVIGNQKYPSFKRELIKEEQEIYPTGLAIPKDCIITEEELMQNLKNKKQQYQLTAPNFSLFKPETDLGNRVGHKFTDETLYNQDIKNSWFGLVCKRGGWDSLRIYEIIANGALLLYRDYDKKPVPCSPCNLPEEDEISYSTEEELYAIMNQLVVDGKPTQKYLDLLYKQRNWLLENGTCEARASKIIEILKVHVE